jgi:hypothetical protein
MGGHLNPDNNALGFCEIEFLLERVVAFALREAALPPEN